MNVIQTQKIAIASNRQRREFDPAALTELANDILKNGLMHPVVVRRQGDPCIAETFLVAGERRIRAIEQLAELGQSYRFDGTVVEPGHVPCVTLGELSPLEAEEAELSENIIRVDLTWQERVKAIARLHELRQAQHGKGNTAAKPEEPKGWFAKDTAKEVGLANASDVTKAVVVADHLDDPMIMKAASQSEAIKLVQKKMKHQHRMELAATFDASKTQHVLHLGDCLDLIKREDAGKYDIILSDPPYGIDIHKGASWDGESHDYDDSGENWEALLTGLADEFIRVTKDKAHLYLFCDIGNFSKLRAIMAFAGWDVWPRPLIWYKGNTGAYPRPEHGPRYTYEGILYALKGDKKTTALYHDVICINNPIKQDHPAGKPVELYNDLLKRSASPGDFVLDPFCGSGPIFGAATEQKCIATGFELNPKYHAMSVAMLEKLGGKNETGN